MIISSQFDGGNIECIDCSNPSRVLLNIRADRQSEFYQGFYFRAANVRDLDCRYLITNAAGRPIGKAGRITGRSPATTANSGFVSIPRLTAKVW